MGHICLQRRSSQHSELLSRLFSSRNGGEAVHGKTKKDFESMYLGCIRKVTFRSKQANFPAPVAEQCVPRGPESASFQRTAA